MELNNTDRPKFGMYSAKTFCLCGVLLIGFEQVIFHNEKRCPHTPHSEHSANLMLLAETAVVASTSAPTVRSIILQGSDGSYYWDRSGLGQA